MPGLAADRSNFAKDTIRALAAEHGVIGEFTAFDARMGKISQLSGETNIELDETELLLVALRRSKVIADVEAIRLHAEYLAR